MRCKQVVEGATEYTEGAGGPLFRLRMHQHLQGCDGCRVYIQQLRVTSEVLASLPARELAPAERQWALTAYQQARAQWASASAAQLAPAPRVPTTLAAAAATALAAIIGALFARGYAPAGRAWIEAGSFACAALCLVMLAPRQGVLAGALSLAGSLLLLAFTEPGELAAAGGIRCAMHELVTAAIPIAAWLSLRGPQLASKAQLIGLAAAGALASDAVLHVTCPAASQLHALVFHVGGVVAAAAITGLCAGKLLQVGLRSR